jgi:adenine-specific DNA-methyltransferase
MDKLKFQTPDLTAENIARHAALFPGVVTDGLPAGQAGRQGENDIHRPAL